LRSPEHYRHLYKIKKPYGHYREERMREEKKRKERLTKTHRFSAFCISLFISNKGKKKHHTTFLSFFEKNLHKLFVSVDNA
jgi:hypothetical protein